MPIFQQGSLNTTALIVPDLYVQIVPPNQLLLNGVPTNVLGIVGTASWGPVGTPTIAGSPAEYAQFFGPVMNRQYDIGTALALATLQGAQFFNIIRVTDGTDTAASGSITGTDLTQSVTVAGVAKAGDVLSLAITPAGGVLTTVTYTVSGTDVQSGAAGLAAAVNGSGYLAMMGFSADTPLAGVFKLHYQAVATAVVATVGGTSPTTTVTLGVAGTTAATNMITFKSIFTGSYGDNELVNISNGSAVGTWRVTVAMPGFVPETFDNLGLGLKGNAVWQAIASAINNGVSGIRGPSQYLRATAGAGAVVPAVAQVALSGGTDGAGNVGTAEMLGSDTVPRTGMYAMRSQGVSIGILADCYDSSSWSTQVAFGLFEGIYMIMVGPPSDTIASATGPTGTKAIAGIDSYAAKMLFGDWVYWFDTVNNVQRLVSPQGVIGGLLSNLSPQNSSLNKQVYGLIGTQKSMTGLTYTSADLQTLATAGWDVIANPIPAGNMFGGRLGRNSSSNAVVHGDNYTRMTNYIAATLNRGMGLFIGQLQSRRPNDKTRAAAKATLDAFMQALLDQGMIDDFQNVCDNSNNPASRIALGYMQADCQVVYLSVVEYFIVNLQGGQSVTINRVSSQPAGVGTFAASPNASLVSAVNV
jgi:hypothetical protein